MDRSRKQQTIRFCGSGRTKMRVFYHWVPGEAIAFRACDDVLIDILRFTTRRELAALELSCRRLCNLIDHHFTETPFLVFPTLTCHFGTRAFEGRFDRILSVLDERYDENLINSRQRVDFAKVLEIEKKEMDLKMRRIIDAVIIDNTPKLSGVSIENNCGTKQTFFQLETNFGNRIPEYLRFGTLWLSLFYQEDLTLDQRTHLHLPILRQLRNGLENCSLRLDFDVNIDPYDQTRFRSCQAILNHLHTQLFPIIGNSSPKLKIFCCYLNGYDFGEELLAPLLALPRVHSTDKIELTLQLSRSNNGDVNFSFPANTIANWLQNSTSKNNRHLEIKLEGTIEIAAGFLQEIKQLVNELTESFQLASSVRDKKPFTFLLDVNALFNMPGFDFDQPNIVKPVINKRTNEKLTISEGSGIIFSNRWDFSLKVIRKGID